MIRFLKVLIPILLIIYLLHVVNVLVYPYPFYVNNHIVNHIFFYSFAGSVFLLGVDLMLLNFININQKKYLLFYISFLCLALSVPTWVITKFVYIIPSSMELEMQSVSEPKHKIFSQHIDYGAFGDSYKEVSAFEIFPGFLFTEPDFKNSDLTGEWYKFENNKIIDRIKY